MGAFFGSLSAVGIGLSDLYGRRVVTASGVLTAAAVMQFVALLTSVSTIPFVASEFRWDDIFLGAISGVGMGLGLALYYGGIARSSATVVSPLVATLAALIPLSYTAVTGTPLSAAAVVGAVVALAGLVLVTTGGTAAVNVRTGFIWGLAAGVSYGIGLTAFIETSSESGSWPAVSQRCVAVVLMVAVALIMRVSPVPPRGVRVAGLLAGICAGLSTVFYLIGVQTDARSAVVTASMFPAVSVAIGRMFFGDPVSRTQVYGIAAVLAGVATVVAA